MNIENWILVKDQSGTSKEYKMVKCIAEIRNNETGEIKEYLTNEPFYLGSEHPSVFNWEENNFSCDCNRHLFFTDGQEELECSDGKYSVNLKNAKDGKIYYSEF